MIRPSPSRRRPFEQLAASPGDLANVLQAERDALPVLLSDWTHSTSDAIYSQYFKTGAFPHCVDSILANGRGRVQCLPQAILEAGVGLGLDTGKPTMSGMIMGDQNISANPAIQGIVMNSSSMSAGTTMPDMSMNEPMTSSTKENSVSNAATSMFPLPSEASTASGMSSMSGMASMAGKPDMMCAGSMSSMKGMGPLNSKGCTPPMMFKPGYNVSSLPARTCSNTTSSLLEIRANHTQGWLALNLVNVGAVSTLAVSLDAHSMFVYASDGLFTALQEVKVSSSWSRLHFSLTPLGASYVYWPTIFGNDPAESACRRFLFTIRHIPIRRHAASARRESHRSI